MVNGSKSRDLRFFLRWMVAGALGGVGSDAERCEGAIRYCSRLKVYGNLTDQEAGQLAYWEYFSGPVSVADQFARYYLKLKECQPVKAEAMRQLVSSTVQIGESTEVSFEDIRFLCAALRQYWGGFLIRQNGISYTYDREGFRIA